MAVDSAEVLAVPSDALLDFYDRTEFRSDREGVCDALNAIRSHGRYYLRQWAERTESVRQIIPCVIVRNGARLLCVKRAKKGRKDLRLRYTLLFGGHVDAEDSNGDREHILHRCAERELHEELGLNAPVSPNPIGVVVDLETASSRRHFGVVFECPISDTVVSVRRECDNSEFTHSRHDNDYPLLEPDELVSKKFDPWSTLFLTSDFARQNFGTPKPAFAVQLPLGLLSG